MTENQTLAPGQTLRFRYRVIVHSGDAASAGIAAFDSGPMPSHSACATSRQPNVRRKESVSTWLLPNISESVPDPI